MAKIEHLLLIDDSEATNNFHNRLLARLNFADKITTTSNGKEALDYLNDTMICPELIFLDLNMPILDGFEFLERAKPIIEKRFDKKPTIIVLTSSEEQVDIDRCKELYAEILFYTKPLTIDQINLITEAF